MFDSIRNGDILTYGAYVLMGYAVGDIAPRFRRLFVKSSCILGCAINLGLIAALASEAIAGPQLQRIAAENHSPRNFFVAEMMAYGGMACMTLGAAGYGASLGSRLARRILG